jgi:hypothetical protein
LSRLARGAGGLFDIVNIHPLEGEIAPSAYCRREVYGVPARKDQAMPDKYIPLLVFGLWGGLFALFYIAGLIMEGPEVPLVHQRLQLVVEYDAEYETIENELEAWKDGDVTVKYTLGDDDLHATIRLEKAGTCPKEN